MKRIKKIVIANKVELTQLLLSIIVTTFIALKEKEINLFYIAGLFLGFCFTFFIKYSYTIAKSRKI